MPSSHVLLQETPLSIVIGVTGHRDLRPHDVERLQSVFEHELRAAAKRYPDSSFILLSSLAEGADRLAARVALGLGIQLVAPLPLPRALYEEDFVTSESRAEFADLLNRAIRVIELPLLPGVSEADVCRHGPARNLEYAKVGEYIGRQSQIFFAFWDGTPGNSDTVGGTGYTVNLRLAGAPIRPGYSRRFRTFSFTTGPVIQIETVRQSHPDSMASGATRVLLPPDTRLESFELICARMNQFNRDAHHLRVSLAAVGKASHAQLLNTDLTSAPAILAALPSSCQQIANQYAIADGLAVHFARRTNAALKSVSLGVAAAAVFFNMHSSYFAVPDDAPASMSEAVGTFPWYLMAFVVLSTYTASWLYGRAQRAEYQTRYLDYRSLAEALRIQFFWRVTAVPDLVVDNYLRNQRSELEWLRAALKSFDVMTTPAEPAGTSRAGATEFGLLMAWIRDQRRYFARKAKTEETRRRLEASTVEWLLKASGAISVLLALALAGPFLGHLFFGTAWPWLLTGPAHAFLMVAIPMLAVGAGLLDRYSRQVAREEHIRQFASMSAFFDAGERELEALLKEGRYPAATGLARNLGLEALDDNGDWLILHRERPLELPPG